MKRTSQSFAASLLILLVLTCAGCASISSAYASVADTVSGWFKSDAKK
jgi:hypothetical protein